jgi:hypothetical protein
MFFLEVPLQSCLEVSPGQAVVGNRCMLPQVYIYMDILCHYEPMYICNMLYIHLTPLPEVSPGYAHICMSM